jgi:prophage regulatory protein
MLNDLIKKPEPDEATRTLNMTIAAEKRRSDGPRNWDNANIVRPRDLPDLTGLSRTTIWRLERAGLFPQRIRLSAGAVGYRISEIRVWADTRETVGGSHES